MNVSIIVPAYNAADTIAETLQSLLDQKFTNWEAIVVNDGSTDTTAEVVQSFIQRDKRIRLFSQSNKGLSGARNSGVGLARYDWLFFLDADDWIFPEHLKRMIGLLEADPSLDVVYCGWTYVLPDGDHVFQQCAGLVGDLFVPFAQYCVSVVHTFLVPRSFVESLGRFDNSLKSCEDWALWQRIARTGARFGVVNEILAAYRTRPNSLSRNGYQLLQDGIEVLTRAYGPDPRVPQSHPVYPDGLPQEQLTKMKFDLLCACAGYLIGGGKDARPLLDVLKSEQATLNPFEVANCIFIHAMVSASRPRSEWYKIWFSFQQNLENFLVALETTSGTPKLASSASWVGKQLIMKHAQRSTISGHVGAAWANLMIYKLKLPIQIYRMGQSVKCSLWAALLMMPEFKRTVLKLKHFLWSSRKLDLSNHPSNNAQDHFEQLFTEHPDPWDYTNAYEQAKYEQTLAMIPDGVIADALELACAEGLFTVQFAPRVQHLLATDISETALTRTKKRCANLDNVTFQCLDFVTDLIPGCFDLIVCSEVLYFVGDRRKLIAIADKFVNALKPGGYLLMTHSNVLIDDPYSSGFDWGHAFGAKYIGETFERCRYLEFVKELRSPLYRIQLFRRNSQKNFLSHSSSQKSVEVLEAVDYQHLPPEIAQGVVLNTTNKLPILSYRCVAPTTQPQSVTVTPEAFESQLHYLHEQGYQSINLEEWRYCMELGTPATGKRVSITFDDSNQDFLTYAWPLLKKYGFSATLFLYSDEIGKVKTWDLVHKEEIQLIEWKQVRQLQAEGLIFGSHGASRGDVTQLSLRQAWQEMKRSRIALENELAISIYAFAYPYGKSNSLLQYLLGVCGYELGLTGNSGLCTLNNSQLASPQIDVTGTDNLETFAAKLSDNAFIQ